jgi:hypothetical protein
MNIALVHYSAPPVVGGVEKRPVPSRVCWPTPAGWPAQVTQVRILAGRGAQADGVYHSSTCRCSLARVYWR